MANEYKTLAVGTIFTYKDNKYQVCKDNDCKYTCPYCAFRGTNCDNIRHIRGNCVSNSRIDHIGVYYKQINNNKTMKKDSDNIIIPTFSTNNSLNDLQIDCPKGYSIDVNNSDLSKGIIKFKKDYTTLEDIYDNQGKDTFITNVVNNNKNTYNKISAIAKLIDIANYYNKDWKPDWNDEGENKYFICYSKRINEYNIACSNLCRGNFVYFKNKGYAQDVIKNFEFRDILDAIYKD